MEVAKIVPLMFLLVSRTSGYTSTVVHLPHNQASSAVQFDLSQPNSLRAQRQQQITPNAYQSTNYIKSTFPQNDAQPQLFNLGYSVRFEQNQQPPQAPQRMSPKMHFVNAKLNQGDIITGTRKQNVQVDLPSASSQEQYPKDIQKRKVLGRNVVSLSSGPLNTKAITAQANLSPTTQRNLEALETIKDVNYQQQLADLYQQKYTWRNLSPNVKIIQSTEIPSPHDRIENRAMVFDHAKALSKSEGFGFSDAIHDDNARIIHQKREEPRFIHSENIQPTLESYRVIPVLEQENEPIVIFDNKENVQDASPAENFRAIQIPEQINEPLLKTQFTSNQPFSFVGHTNHEAIKDINQSSQTDPETKPKMVQIIPATLFQTVDGTPLKPHPIQQDIITQQIPKQVVIQPLKIPYNQYNFKKFPTKIKYIKQIPMSGNVRHKMKVVSSIDYPRKARIKPELRRNFILPSTDYEIYI
ncbi:hypothetical protein WA026_016139 [Henosepilachna vigintioctopunctata]|uniref:Uncharacterized protein n=1 Tax=Henosepilachna vigintioctopunctata TaxID=420089 RepID=A0AAW1TUN4_9CUCU